MLNPSPSDPEHAVADARVQDAKAEPRAAELDPSWRAGRKLEEARKQLGLSIKDLAERIKVRPEFLEALEAMNVKLLPGKAYALAFLRSYANALGLDEKAISDQFQDECALTREDAQKQIRDPSSRPHPERPWLAAAALLTLAAGFVAWRAASTGEQSAEAPAVVVSGRGEATAPGPAAIVGEPPVIEIRALAPEWLEARGPDGTVFLSRTLQAGDVYRPDPSPGWTLHARDGGAFEIYVDGVPAGLLGQPGMHVLGRPLDGIRPAAESAALNQRPGG